MPLLTDDGYVKGPGNSNNQLFLGSRTNDPVALLSPNGIQLIVGATIFGIGANGAVRLSNLTVLGNLTMGDGINIILNATTGTRFGTATNQRLGFYNATPVVQQTDGATLTNNVTAGGTTDQLDDFTSLTVYATDAAAIRNDIYQLGRKLKIAVDALRAYGLLS